MVVDTRVWFKASADNDGNHYITYILVYGNDIIIVGKEHHKFMSMLKENYNVKPSSTGEPKLYVQTS